MDPIQKLIRKEKEFNLRRAEILSKAEEIFAAKGFYATTIGEIAAASGFAVGTLYQYFESKEQLFAALVSEKLEIFYGGIREAVAGRESTLDKIRGLVEAHFSFVEKNSCFCAILIRRESTYLAGAGSTLHDRMISDYLEHIAFIEAVMTKGVKARHLREQDPRLLAFALAGMINSFTFAWINLPPSASLAEMTETLLAIFLEGVKAVE